MSIKVISFLTIIALAYSAIIASPVFSLARTYQYEINIQTNAQNFTEYALISSDTDNCKNKYCYYAWIFNYTLNEKTVQAYNPFLGVNLPFFYLQIDQGSEYSLTYSKQLKNRLPHLLSLTSKLISHIFTIHSNLNPFNAKTTGYINQALYKFKIRSQLNESSIQEIKDKAIQFKQKQDLFQITNSTYVGWAIPNKFKDVIQLQRQNKNLLYRQITLFQPQEISIRIELISKSLFMDLGIFKEALSLLPKNSLEKKSYNNYMITKDQIQRGLSSQLLDQ